MNRGTISGLSWVALVASLIITMGTGVACSSSDGHVETTSTDEAAYSYPAVIPKPVVQPLDQSAQTVFVTNTAFETSLTVTNQLGSQFIQTVDDLDLNWGSQTPMTALGDLSTETVMTGDFAGAGSPQLLVYNATSGAWLLGSFAGTVLTATQVATKSFGVLATQPDASMNESHAFYVLGNFSGLVPNRTEVMVYQNFKFYLGTLQGNTLTFTQVSDTTGFGNLNDGKHYFWSGHFTGATRAELLFHWGGDGHIWLGTGASQTTTVTWTLQGTFAYGSLLASTTKVLADEFTTTGTSELMIYTAPASPATAYRNLWTRIRLAAGGGSYTATTESDVTGFGNLLDNQHVIMSGHFTSGLSGPGQIQFYFTGDTRWWIAPVSHPGFASMQWTNLGQFFVGTLPSSTKLVAVDEFTGAGEKDVLIYFDSGDVPADRYSTGDWLRCHVQNPQGLGLVEDCRFDANSRGLGSLLDGHHSVASGKFTGTNKADVFLYGAGAFSLGRFDGYRVDVANYAVGDSITATQSAIGQNVASDPVVIKYNVGTNHYDRTRSGWNPNDTVFNYTNISTLHQLYTISVDDEAYAQPLLVHGVITGGVAHDVLFVATESDSVYAFDAAASSATQLWKASLLPTGEEPASTSDDGCSNITPNTGITGTPVIDPSTSTLYVVTKSRVAGADPNGANTFHARIHALDLSSGAEKVGSPQEIAGSYANATFYSHVVNNRAGLLLDHKRLYIAFGSHCDVSTYYRGWMFAYDARTLDQLAMFQAAQNEGATTNGYSGIWQSGIGPAADLSGHINFTTGNGNINQAIGKYGESVLRLSASITAGSPPLLPVYDYFTVYNGASLNANDWDLGSGGVTILPNGYELVGGKQGYLYNLSPNPGALGGYQTGPGGTDGVFQRVELYPGITATSPGSPMGSDAVQIGLFGGVAYAKGPTDTWVYACGNYVPPHELYAPSVLTDAQSALTGKCDKWRVNSDATLTNPAPWQQTTENHFHAPTVVVSSNNNAATRIVWLINRVFTSSPPQPSDTVLSLVALNGQDLTQKLAQLVVGQGTTGAGNWRGVAMIEPTVADGRVWAAFAYPAAGSSGPGGIAVFGL